jgi:hypothetical protein
MRLYASDVAPQWSSQVSDQHEDMSYGVSSSLVVFLKGSSTSDRWSHVVPVVIRHGSLACSQQLC